MTILKVLEFPDDRLRKVAKPVDEFNQELKTLINDMQETMYHENGIGLAATQIDRHIQLIVIDISEEKNSPMVLINPKIISSSGETGIEEGCLSVPSVNALVKRYEKINVQFKNEKFEDDLIAADDLLAICIQHEIDHLNGKLFIDHLSPLKRNRLKKKLEKIKKQQTNSAS
ncbi:peptide deformylase [Paraphotobacterium marinum]|uniref:Peptide deformylase n=1 Tax=Paraphotobacterium marinum TaxID=1755811 RepID=A0A220VCG6_9GAMM|nr:peptide deformylase [Paraphotobacterium marinum]ASK78098.1 peptide deformylase [Paraphotobacterium marinum]